MALNAVEFAERIQREEPLLSSIRRQTNRHRETHGKGCDAFPSNANTVRFIRTLAGSAQGGRTLEVGCGLGLTAIALAWGMGTGRVETVEKDPLHASLARKNFMKARVINRIRIREGNADEILSKLRRPYDIILEDAGYGAVPPYYEDLVRLLRPGGFLLWENWFPLDPEVPGIADDEFRGTQAWARKAFRDRRLRTTYLRGTLGLSVRRP